jgi:hypothetical protein
MPVQASSDIVSSSREMWDFLYKLNPIRIFGYMNYRRNTFHGFMVNVSNGSRVERFFELRHNGFLSVGYTPELSEKRGISVMDAVFDVPEFLRGAYEIYQKIGYHSYLRVGLVVAGVANSRLTNQHGISLGPSQDPPDVDPLVITREVAADDLPKDMLDISKAFILRVAQSYGMQIFDIGPGELDVVDRQLDVNVKGMLDWHLP